MPRPICPRLGAPRSARPGSTGAHTAHCYPSAFPTLSGLLETLLPIQPVFLGEEGSWPSCRASRGHVNRGPIISFAWPRPRAGCLRPRPAHLCRLATRPATERLRHIYVFAAQDSFLHRQDLTRQLFGLGTRAISVHDIDQLL